MLVALAPIAWAGFGLGSDVRRTLSQIAELPPGVEVVLSLDAGDGRTLFQRVPAAARPSDNGCEIRALDGQAVPRWQRVDADVRITLFEDTWIAEQRFVAGSPGLVGVRCMSGDWALAPDVGDNGLGIVTTFADWSGRSALFVVPGLIVGAIMAVVIGLRRSESAPR